MGKHVDKQALLRQISFGHRIAEEETDVLTTYFVETDQWLRLYKGEIDVVYGPKGAGKSALYSLLLTKSDDLFDRGILMVAGENPRGAPAFKDLATDPPTTEREFVGLWKLYIVTLIQHALAEYETHNDAAERLTAALTREGLVKGDRSLGALLHVVMSYVRRALRPQSVEGAISLDPTSGQPGINGKIVFSEADRDKKPDSKSIDELLTIANEALDEQKVSVWILLDRLDVAFAEEVQLESNALRALFRAYLDIGALSRISLKIFLRTDIWSRIVEGGFREASHITRSIHISWNRSSLLNLIIRRLLHNEAIRTAYGVNETLTRGNVSEQEVFFYRVCPDQVDVGSKKPKTIDWVLSRTRDGGKLNAPREVIHFFNSLRDVQAKRLEIGESVPEKDQLFASPSFKEALPEVSQVRVEQTLYAEFPQVKQWIEQLRREKTRQSASTLARIWGVSDSEASSRAVQLAGIGLFETQGSRQFPEYWVPFLYRDFLELVQGAAEASLTKQDNADD